MFSQPISWLGTKAIMPLGTYRLLDRSKAKYESSHNRRGNDGSGGGGGRQLIAISGADVTAAAAWWQHAVELIRRFIQHDFFIGRRLR